MAITKEQLAKIQERAEKATNEVYSLANGSKKFTMSIPPRLDDSDLTVIVSLEDIPDLLVELEWYQTAYFTQRDAKIKLQTKLRKVQEVHIDESGFVWENPTAWAYAATCKALHKHKDQERVLQKALEKVLIQIHVHGLAHGLDYKIANNMRDIILKALGQENNSQSNAKIAATIIDK